MPSYGERLGGRAVRPLRRGVASSEEETSYLLEGGSLPSSEAEKGCPLEGRSATLERGGDVSRSRESRGEPSSEAEFVQRALEGPSSEAEIVPRVRGGCEWAARWTSSSPFLSSGFGRRPGAFVAPVALTCVCVFESGLSTTIRVSLIVAPDIWGRTSCCTTDGVQFWRRR